MELKQYLKACGLTQLQFAKQIGVTQAMVSSVIHGRYKLRGAVAIQWSKATNWHVTPHEFNRNDFPHPEDGLPR